MRIPLLFILLVVPLSACAATNPPKVCINDACVVVDIADTDSARAQGLMFRPALAKDAGMLFLFPVQDSYGFWMKNMQFDLDILWLDDDKRIVDIKTSVPACRHDDCPTYVPQKKARYVLEVVAGFCESHQVHIGDKAVFFPPRRNPRDFSPGMKAYEGNFLEKEGASAFGSKGSTP